MSASNIRLLLSRNGLEVTIPIEQVWDFQGEQQAIETYEATVLNEILNKDEDFEVSRFDHKDYDSLQTSLNYEFYFQNQTFNPPIYENSYLQYFTTNQVYYYTNPFTKSFWKLDFYTSPSTTDQKAYITTILPVQQGLLQTANLNGTTTVQIKKPKYVLDYIGDKEGFFIYWLKKRDFIDVDEFYMTAKFFDGSTGQFIKMMNRPQTSLSNPTEFPPADYFYYKVELDYPTQTFQVLDYPSLTRVGTEETPIKWYEYVNPS